MADLGSLGGGRSRAWGMNSNGQVVGYSDSEVGTAAFLYTGRPGVDGHMIDLDAWLDATNPTAGAKWTLDAAYGLNDTGLITGGGWYDDGPGGLSDGFRAYLLDASALVSTSLPGDYNQNGVVDAADYVVWRNNVGSAVLLPNDDTPGVGRDDYDRWKAHFGQTASSHSGSAVPELSTSVLILLAVVGTSIQRHRLA